MITIKYINFGSIGILLIFTWLILGLTFEYLAIDIPNNNLLGISEINTDNTTMVTSEKDASSLMAKNNVTNMTMTPSATNDVNGSLTTLIPGGPQGVEDRRHAPS